MPPRTNLFQDVVSIIHEHLAGDATVERSAMLPNRLTGKKREVDVVIRAKTGPGYETVIAIEAVGRGRAATADWVESMVGKHKNLPTSQVVLVAEGGFSEQARELALAEKMIPIEPKMLDDPDPALKLLHSLRSLWPKVVNLTPIRAELDVDVPGQGIETVSAPPDLHIFAEDGSHIELLPMVKALLDANIANITEQIDLRNIAEDLDTHAEITVGPGWMIEQAGEQRSLYVARRAEGQALELFRIDGMKITAKAVIHVGEVQMQSRRLAEIDVNYAFGEGPVGDGKALIVITEGESGGKLSVQFSQGPTAPAANTTGRSNFNHAPCYEKGLHDKTKQGRAWCRKHGPAATAS